MPHKPDLHNLPTWGDENADPPDRPDPAEIERRRDELHNVIHALPAGSLSGGQRFYDPSDRATMIFSEDERDRAFARDFLGVNETNLPEGLSHSEKRLLIEAADEEVDSISAPQLRKEASDNKRFMASLDRLWRDFAIDYPEDARYESAEAAAALQRLVQSSGMTRGQLADLAEERPSTVTRMIWGEMKVPYSHAPEPRAAAQSIDGSTTSLSYGGYGGARRKPAEDTRAGSVFDGVIPFGGDRRRG